MPLTARERSAKVAAVPALPLTASCPSSGDADADALLLDRLRAGDAGAFAELVGEHAASMLRVARLHVPTRAIAEEVVQETWLAVLQGLARFEGRCSLKTWVFTILTNRAKTRGERERRTVPCAALAAGHARWPHHWAAPAARWEESPDLCLQAAETLALVRRAIDALPAMQRRVITMRDLEDRDGAEICGALSITRANQRVLLHRARSGVRAALEEHLNP